MKDIRIAFAAAISMLLVSCQEELREIQHFDEDNGGASEEMVFYASSETPTHSKAAVQEDARSIWWEPGDQIKIYSGSSAGIFSTRIDRTSASAEFKGALSGGETGDDYIAVYPSTAAKSIENGIITINIPSVQEATENSFDPKAYVALARTTGTELTFYGICGGLKFTLSRDDVIKVELKEYKNELMGTTTNTVAGTYKAYINTYSTWTSCGISSTVSGSSAVSLQHQNGQALKADTPYYIVLSPHTMRQYVVRLYTASGAVGVFTSSKSVDVKRAKFGVIEELDRLCSWSNDTIQVPQAIDLGLPSGLKWASFNLGASQAASYGCYLAWGETVARKGPFDFNLKSYDVEGYNSSDKITTLTSSDDAATVNLGPAWRMPTEVEFKELIDNCQWTWCRQSGIYGSLVTGPNGNSIFLPAAGNSYNGMIISLQSSGIYWSSSLSTETTSAAMWLTFNETSAKTGWNARAMGAQIRPVTISMGAYIPLTDISLSADKARLKIGNTLSLSVYFSPADATDKKIAWKSSNEKVATVDASGIVTGISDGSVIITAHAADNVTASCVVEVFAGAPDAVDLGLPSGTLWGTFNMGANSPEGHGNKYKWGEIKPSVGSAYKWYDANGYTKYNRQDNLFKLEPVDDAACSEYGELWHIPSLQEQLELLNPENCSWERGTVGGVTGYKVNSRRNGNSIFLPDGQYWSSTLNPSISLNIGKNCPYACEMVLKEDNAYMQDEFSFSGGSWQPMDGSPIRSSGNYIRPVYGRSTSYPEIEPESLTLNVQSLSVELRGSSRIYALVHPTWYGAGDAIEWFSNDEKVATVSPQGTVSGLREGTCVITASANGGMITQQCSVNVYKGYSSYIPEAIDLGLPSGTKWASFNLGATSPEEDGWYYAWGETSPREGTPHDWEHYKWWDNTEQKLTKYCTQSGFGVVDNKTVLESEDDAARRYLGSSWRIPTSNELTELLDNCKRTKQIYDGVEGFMLESKINGNSIFIPASGALVGNEVIYKGVVIGLTTTDLSYNSKWFTGELLYYSMSSSVSTDPFRTRCYGHTIRPVTN